MHAMYATAWRSFPVNSGYIAHARRLKYHTATTNRPFASAKPLRNRACPPPKATPKIVGDRTTIAVCFKSYPRYALEKVRDPGTDEATNGSLLNTCRAWRANTGTPRGTFFRNALLFSRRPRGFAEFALLKREKQPPWSRLSSSSASRTPSSSSGPSSDPSSDPSSEFARFLGEASAFGPPGSALRDHRARRRSTAPRATIETHLWVIQFSSSTDRVSCAANFRMYFVTNPYSRVEIATNHAQYPNAFFAEGGHTKYPSASDLVVRRLAFPELPGGFFEMSFAACP